MVLLVLACSLAALTGCVSSGTKIEMANIAQLKKGVSTRAEMDRLFGKPTSVTLLPDGRTMATWFYVKASNNVQNFIPIVNVVQTKIDSETQMLQASFSTDGVLENFTTNDSASSIKAGLVN